MAAVVNKLCDISAVHGVRIVHPHWGGIFMLRQSQLDTAASGHPFMQTRDQTRTQKSQFISEKALFQSDNASFRFIRSACRHSGALRSQAISYLQ